jgi:hypothetical protein
MADLDAIDRRRVGEIVRDIVQARAGLIDTERKLRAIDPAQIGEELIDELARYGFEVRRV